MVFEHCFGASLMSQFQAAENEGEVPTFGVDFIKEQFEWAVSVLEKRQKSLVPKPSAVLIKSNESPPHAARNQVLLPSDSIKQADACFRLPMQQPVLKPQA